MGIELRERKWCGVLGIEKVGVEGYWKFVTIVHGLIQTTLKIKSISINNHLST